MKVNILDCPYYSTTLKEITKFLITHIKNNGPLVQIITVNSSILVNSRKDLRLQGILKDNQIGMEWFYRMIQEPRRLFKRYLYSNTMFIILIIKEICVNYFKRK